MFHSLTEFVSIHQLFFVISYRLFHNGLKILDGLNDIYSKARDISKQLGQIDLEGDYKTILNLTIFRDIICSLRKLSIDFSNFFDFTILILSNKLNF